MVKVSALLPGSGRLHRLAWVPIPLFLLLFAGLRALDLRTSYENPVLLLALNFLFSTLVSVFVAVLIGRAFLARGRPGFLLLGSGVIFWGTAGTLGAAAAIVKDGPAFFDPNVTVTIANICYWLSALAHLAGAAVSVRWRLSLAARRRWLAAAYAVAITVVALVAFATLAGWLPKFFIQGGGGTTVRQFVLASAAILYLLAALLLRSGDRDRLTPFTSWYSLALLLLAEAMLGLLFISVLGSILNWTGRLMQAVAGIYMLAAALTAWKDAKRIDFDLEVPSERPRHPHAIAIALALSAAVLKMTLLHQLAVNLLIFNSVVVVAALYGGFRAGITATVAACGLIGLFLRGGTAGVSTGPLLIFFASGVVMSWLVHAMHRAHDRALAAETEAATAKERERAEAELARTLREAYERTEAIVAERTQELRQKETLLRAVLETLPVAVYLLNARGDLDYNNPAANLLWRGDRDLPAGDFRHFRAWWHGTEVRLRPEDWIGTRAIRDGESAVGEIIDIEAFDGTRKTILNSGAPIRNAAGEIVGAVVVNEDITDQQEMQKQLLHAQKLDSIGSLAGGIAHDFNNLLMTIKGYAEMVHEDLEDEALRANLRQVLTAGEKAQDLTRKLLAFSRQEVAETKALDLSASFEGMLRFIARIIGEDIRIVSDLDPQVLPVRGNAGQIEQVLMNILVNARDAMPGGGTLTLTSGRMRAERIGTLRELEQGRDYAYVRITDTGTGIARKDLDRIFEPYFTTKAAGKGTGLGLAIAYGIVRQHQGTIAVASSPGHGTTFTIYLPLTAELAPAPPAPVAAEIPKGAETILVVEDDAAVRTLLRLILEKAGYKVVLAENAARALACLGESDADVLLTDVIMPEMNGMEMYAEMRKRRPDLKVIFASGYSADIVKNQGLDAGSYRFLQKPLTREPLLRTIREVLDAEPIRASA